MTGQNRFALRLQLHVNELDEQGYPMSSSGLTIQDNIVLGEMGFFEIAALLGRFHELAQTIERERTEPMS